MTDPTTMPMTIWDLLVVKVKVADVDVAHTDVDVTEGLYADKVKVGADVAGAVELGPARKGV